MPRTRKRARDEAEEADHGLCAWIDWRLGQIQCSVARGDNEKYSTIREGAIKEFKTYLPLTETDKKNLGQRLSSAKGKLRLSYSFNNKGIRSLYETYIVIAESEYDLVLKPSVFDRSLIESVDNGGSFPSFLKKMKPGKPHIRLTDGHLT